jgi:hypothetical protein
MQLSKQSYSRSSKSRTHSPHNQAQRRDQKVKHQRELTYRTLQVQVEHRWVQAQRHNPVSKDLVGM